MRPEMVAPVVKPSKHSRRYMGVELLRESGPMALEFNAPIVVKMTATPPWVRLDRRRAAAKRARLARKKNRP